MLSYLAAVPKSGGNDQNFKILISSINQYLPDYKIVFSSKRAMVFISGENTDKSIGVYRLACGSGVIAGRLFKRQPTLDYGYVPWCISETVSHEVVVSCGEHLVSDFWGRYVGFIFDEQSERFTVVRDPSGALFAYFIETDDFFLFFSNSEDFSKLRICKLTYNIDHLVSYVQMGLLDCPDTGFKEIRKVQRGAAVIIDSEGVYHRQYWRSRDFISKNHSWTEKSAAEALRYAVKDSVAAWASQFNHIALNLSGGLDSSIVLACLKQMPNPPEIVALNLYYPTGLDSDERQFARLMADHVGVNIIHSELNANDVNLEHVKEFIAEAEPIPGLGSITMGEFRKRFVEKHGVECFFTGHGGDMVFYQGGVASAQDYIWYEGVSLGLFKQCAQSALLSKSSFWKVFYDSMKTKFHHKEFSFREFLKPVNYLINENLFYKVRLDGRFPHWYDELKNLSYAKAVHVVNTRVIECHYLPNRPNYGVIEINPLLSQPIIELVHSIPTYMFSMNGIDRGLARNSFRDLLPDIIARRQSKGGTEDYFKEVYLNHIPFLRDSLLDGSLIKMGLFDKGLMEKALSPAVAGDSIIKNIVLLNLNLEYWARRWACMT